MSFKTPHDLLWSHLRQNEQEIKKLGIKIKYESIRYVGSNPTSSTIYYNVSGEKVTLKIFGKKYIIGYENVLEDDDDWAQAESQINEYCDDEKGHWMDPKIVLDLILNYTQIKRDKDIDKIFKSRL